MPESVFPACAVILQLRRAVLTLLYGRVHQEAAKAFLRSEEKYCKELEKADGSQVAVVDPLVLENSAADCFVYSWYVPTPSWHEAVLQHGA